MQMQFFRLRVFALLVGVLVLAISGPASADPPSRVARLGYTSGAVSFSPAGENDWVQATINRPLTNGDRLWVDVGARAEIQDGAAVIRLSANTSVSVVNLDDRITQLQLTQGVLNVRVRRLAANQVFEVDTPNLAFTLRQSGNYRIAVDPDGNATDVIVRRGQGEVMGEGAGYLVDAQQHYRFRGADLRDYEFLDAPRPDEFDRWASERDRAFDTSITARYVSRDVVGYQDLDANGNWQYDQTYGNVWVPSRVAADWAPYRDGHWTWIDPWGWTWVDDAPWGFAVSHYGRWAHLGRTWCWVPGPMRGTAYYAPALVVFVGGDNFRLTISSGNVGGVAWFPLAPREAYRPAYSVSRGYFENINRSNTVISSTVINNTYNTYNTTNVTNVTNVVYANRQIPGAVVAVPRNTFVQSQPVSGARVNVSRELLDGTPLAVAPRVAPTEQSVRGGGDRRERPSSRGFERPVVAVTTPPAAHVGFAAQQRQLTLSPGRPLDEAARKDLKPAAAMPAPMVKVLGAVPMAPQPQGAARQASPLTPVAPSVEPRGRAEQRGNDQQRTPVGVAPNPARPAPPPQRAPEPKAAVPPAVPLAPATPAAPPQRPAAVVPVASPSAAPAPPTAPGARPESARVIKQSEPAAPLAVPRPPVAQPPQQQQPPLQPSQRAPEPNVGKPVSALPVQPIPKAEPAAATKQVEPRAPVAASKPSPPPPSPSAAPQAQSPPRAEPHGPKPAPATSKSAEGENTKEASKREEENRKPKAGQTQ
ncbi:MAG: DUF6600 domain-containing protein [Comamonadaceae bacterium]